MAEPMVQEEEEINTIHAHEKWYLLGHWTVLALGVMTLHFLPFCGMKIPIWRLH